MKNACRSYVVPPTLKETTCTIGVPRGKEKGETLFNEIRLEKSQTWTFRFMKPKNLK